MSGLEEKNTMHMAGDKGRLKKILSRWRKDDSKYDPDNAKPTFSATIAL